MPNISHDTQAASGPGAEEGRRPTMVAGPLAASPELADRPRRRTFDLAYKLRILKETDEAVASRSVGALLRREGLYSSLLMDWRRQREAGGLEALSPAKRGPKTAPGAGAMASELARANRENARLRERLARAEAIIDLQKKVSELLGISPVPSDGEP